MEPTSFRARPATSAVILLCTVAFVLLYVWSCVRAEDLGSVALEGLWRMPDDELLTRLGALAAARVWLDGEWWRVGSAGLLHGSWLHLVFNMTALWSVGEWTEKLWGAWRSTGILVLSSLFGCLTSLAWAESSLAVGASAGIFGLAGALVIARAWGSEADKAAIEPVPPRVLGGMLVFWLAVGFVLPLFGVELIAQAGHVGGLVAGLALGVGLSRASGRFETLAWASVVAGTVGVAVMAREPAWRADYHGFLGFELLDRGDYEAAASSFEEALVRDPENAERANSVAWALVEADAELDRAEVLVRRALAAEPEKAEYLDTLGWVLCKQGRTAEGVGVLGEALEVEEDEADRGETAGRIERCADVGG